MTEKPHKTKPIKPKIARTQPLKIEKLPEKASDKQIKNDLVKISKNEWNLKKRMESKKTNGI
ncbi:hypothetical protein [Methanosarcina acetivorans]|uniref:hypothetical protein n=1 Tax=Methanosarcina acetivorans TaxID=2214 RepID=UPI00064F72F8|nr:hypothetical protein [Methanosarcina acetivorans]